MSGGPRIIYFDLEILPNLQEALKFWTQLSCSYETKTLKAQITSACCFGYKVLGEPDVHCINAWDFPGWEANVNDDEELLKAAVEVLKDADAVVTHNGANFDWKYFQTRLKLRRMPALAKTANVDTKRLLSKHLLMFNNKLDNVAEALTDSEKMDHGLGWDLWVRTHGRDPEAMSIMTQYCKQDVLALEAVFTELREFVTNLPNQNLYFLGPEKLCPMCGSSRLRSDGIRSSMSMTYRRYRCLDCHAPLREPLKGSVPRPL